MKPSSISHTLHVLSGSLMLLWTTGCALHLPKDTTLSFTLPAPVKEAIYHASLAPSSHNAQMWQVWVEPKKERIMIIPDPKKQLPLVDPNGRESLLSLGAFTENLRQSLQESGYQVTLEIETQPNQLLNSAITVVIHYKHLKINTVPSEASTRFTIRHTDKRPYLNTPLKTETIEQLRQTASPQIVYFTHNTPQYHYLQKNGYLAFEQQANDLQKRNELAEWLRFSNKEAREKADGLPAEQLNIKGIKKGFYYLFINRESAKKDKFAQQSLKIFQKQIDNQAGFFVITGENTPAAWIKTGIQMEAFWLAATEQKIALHPISQMLEEEPFKSKIQHDLGLKQPVQMIFRAGYVHDYGKNMNVRRPLHTFVFQLINE